MNGWAQGLVLGWLFVGLSACSSEGGEAVNQQLVSIRHLSTEPAGWVSVADDGRYDFLHNGANGAGIAAFGGKLSASELSELRAQLANVEFHEQSDSDYVACESSEQGYTLARKSGAGVCYHASGSSDSASQAAVEFLAEFYRQKSVSP